VLKGDLVTLRPIEAGDYDRLAAFLNDVEVELLAGSEPPRPRSRSAVAKLWDGAADRGDIVFAIEADGRLIGSCSLGSVDPVSQTAELGIGIGERDYWSRGYGREALRLLVDYGFRLRNLRKIWLSVLDNNPRAIRAYEALGFVEEGRQRAHVWRNGGYVDVLFMGLIKHKRQ
jgi:RimJ/RimL family protein N-acetyltransferase